MSEEGSDLYRSVSPTDIELPQYRVRFSICERPSPTGDDERQAAQDLLISQLLEDDQPVKPSDYKSPPKIVRLDSCLSHQTSERELCNASLEKFCWFQRFDVPVEAEQSEKTGEDGPNGDEQSEATSLTRQDSKGYLDCNFGEVLKYRYTIESVLGTGGFGCVFKARDKLTGLYQAIKVIRKPEKYRENGLYEIRNLEIIRKNDPNFDSCCSIMNNSFEYEGHLCIAFPILGKSLFDFLADNDFQPFDMDHVRHIAYQLCHAAKFLHENHLTHSDIKLDNILLVDSSWRLCKDYPNKRQRRRPFGTAIVLIDFGCGTFESERRCQLIQSRPYRAPEVILELPWSYPSDVFSIGICIFEIYTGSHAFEASNNLQHLAMMEHTLGPIPEKMIREHITRARKTLKCFHMDGQMKVNKQSKSYKQLIGKCLPLAEYKLSSDIEDCELISFLKLMLKIDPSARLKMAHAKKHPFFKRLPDYLLLR